MALPGPAAGSEVLQHRLQPVKGAGELRLRRPPFHELVPQVPQQRGLIGREQGEDPVGGGALGYLLPLLLLGVGVQEQVARVDLDDVVQQHHAGHPAQIGVPRCVLRQYLGHHRQVPGVLGRVLRPAEAVAGQHGLPEHGLELADLGDEPHLLVEPLHEPHWISFDQGRGYCGPNPSKCRTTSRATKATRMPTVFAAAISRWRGVPAAG